MKPDAHLQVSIRFKAEDVAKIDAAASHESDRTGYTITRTDFCRAAALKAAQDLLNSNPTTGGQKK